MQRVFKIIPAVFLMVMMMSCVCFASDISIPVKYTATGSNASKGGATITISSDDESAPLPENRTITLAPGQSDKFVISYNEPQGHYYNIERTSLNKVPGRSHYDTASYKVFVMEDNKGKVYTMYQKGKAKKQSVSYIDSLRKKRDDHKDHHRKHIQTGDDVKVIYAGIGAILCLIVIGVIWRMKQK